MDFYLQMLFPHRYVILDHIANFLSVIDGMHSLYEEYKLKEDLKRYLLILVTETGRQRLELKNSKIMQVIKHR